MSEPFNLIRRRFLGVAAGTIAAVPFGAIGTAHAETKPKPAQLPATKPGAHTTFASLKQIDAGVLNVGYAEAGPTDGPVVILLARLALRHLQLCRCRTAAGFRRLPGDRAVSSRLRHDAFSFQ